MWCLSSANDVMVPASRSPWSSIGTQVCLHKHHKFKHTGLCSKNYSVCKIIAYRTGRYTYMINKNYCIKVQSMNSCHTNDLIRMLQLALCNLLILGGLIKGTAFNECLLNSACSLYHWCWNRDTFKELPSYVAWIRKSTYIVNNSITIQALLSHNHWLLNL